MVTKWVPTTSTGQRKRGNEERAEPIPKQTKSKFQEGPQVKDMVRDVIVFLNNKVCEFQGGCIKNNFWNWRELTSDPEVLSTVSGLPIDLLGDLPSNAAFQYPFGTKEHAFVITEIGRLLDKKVIKVSVHEEGQLVSPIFLRAKTDGDRFRMILNLKKLNLVSEYYHFKMDTLKSILTLVTPGTYMTKIDIKDAYYSVPVKPSDQKHFKFLFDNVLYQFMVLPNGYTAGPRKFTKLLKPALATLRKAGITLAAYLVERSWQFNSSNRRYIYIFFLSFS